MVDILLTLFAFALIPFSAVVTWKGNDWHMEGIARRERKVVTRRDARVRKRIERGAASPAIERALHNDFDFACTYWWGDRRPADNDLQNHDFNDGSSPLFDRRCVVCRPYAEGDERSALGYDETGALR